MSTVRAAAYYRMSSDRQEDSIERQRSQVEPYASKQGYSILGDYSDEGIAGDEFDKRPGFQKLLTDAKASKFDVIVADELTRLSRQEVVEFIAKVVHPLKEVGVRVDTVAEGPQGWDDVVQIIMLTIRQDKSSSESPKMARRVLTSQLLLADKCGYTGGPPPYGYKLVPDPVRGKRLVPDGKKADHVRLMFRMVAEGHTLGSVRETLYRRGILSPTGKLYWSRNGLTKILHNRKYVGDFKWGEQASGKHIRQGKGKARGRKAGEVRYATNDEADWIIKPDSHEALVDRETFAKVQAEMAGNKTRTTPHVGGGTFVLNKLLVCGDCGATMLGNSDGGRHNFSCGNYVSYGRHACFKNTVPEAAIVRLLLRKLRDTFLNPESIKLFRDEVRRQHEAEVDPGRVARLKKQLAALETKIEKAGARLLELPKDVIEEAAATLRGWKKEREQLTRDLHSAKTSTRVEDAEKHIEAMEELLGGLDEAMVKEEPILLRQLLREMVSRVELHFTHKQAKVYARSTLTGGIIYVRLQTSGLHLDLGSMVSSSANVAQHVDTKLRNCDLPPGSPLSKNVCTGRLRVSTSQEPSSRCCLRRYATPFW